MVTKLQDQSAALNKMHLISDLFSPMYAKFQSNVIENGIMYNVQTKQCLDQLKKHFLNDNEIRSNVDFAQMAKVFGDVAKDFSIDPLLAIEYLSKKKQRNEAVHYNKRVSDYAKSTAPDNRALAHFLSFYPQLENLFFISEIQSLNSLFCCVCAEFSQE